MYIVLLFVCPRVHVCLNLLNIFFIIFQLVYRSLCTVSVWLCLWCYCVYRRTEYRSGTGS